MPDWWVDIQKGMKQNPNSSGVKQTINNKCYEEVSQGRGTECKRRGSCFTQGGQGKPFRGLKEEINREISGRASEAEQQ